VAKHLGNLALLALTLCLYQASRAQAPALSADSTAAYINATLHQYPTLEFVASGCPGDEQVVSISEDRRSLIIKQNFALPIEGGKCDNVQTLTAPIFNLHLDAIGSWERQAQHTTFFLYCTNSVECFSLRPSPRATPSGEHQWFFRITAPDQVSDRLTAAIRHLVAALLNEADSHIAGNDPFAKHAH
jgi:hypothetical protein